MKILLGWAINALALLALPYVLSGIHVKSFWAALLFALVLGLLNTLIRPLLFLLTLPITILTLGLFLVVINGLLFWLADAVVPSFQVAGFWWAVAGAIVYSIVSWAIGAVVFGVGKAGRD
ncbi:MAG: phage holin family protein [Burkholderiales bacterium]|jgi:putative membrane protein|nr:phage holin family protein [Burkholderiales bacterium]